uniref:Chemosensory protein 9 n=1 Tax=Yemma signatus TaxID=300820 RepID=A0A3G2GRP6_9HEMI|nr:chemosensory protein 9 [Yemma signatus]
MLFLATLIVCGLIGARPISADEENDEDIYNKIFDSVDVDEILNNDRILDTYLKCFFNTGPCSNIAGSMKDKIPEVFETVCGLCTNKQKDIFKHSLDVFIPKRPKDWEHILQIYDPNGAYEPKIMEFLKTWKIGSK